MATRKRAKAKPKLTQAKKTAAAAERVLGPEECLDIAINAAPDAGAFKPDDDPSVVVLFDLGIIDNQTAAIYVKNVQRAIKPLTIKSALMQSARDTTVQDAADSIQTNAV